MMNPVKEKLKTGKATVGTWVNMGNPDIAEQLSMFGFDWLTFDLEHGLMTVPEMQRMMQAMNGTKCLPLVRVPTNDPVYFKWALDMGASGVVVPYVNTKEETSRAVQACKYPPQGIRGCGPRRASRYYTQVTNYVKTSNDDVLVVVMIESQMALDNLDEILSVPGVDAVFVGPDDLSLNLGIFQQRSHPRFESALARVLDACKKHAVAPGMHCNENNINDILGRGFKFCALNDDDTFLAIGTKSCLQGIKGWTPTESYE